MSAPDTSYQFLKAELHVEAVDDRVAPLAKHQQQPVVAAGVARHHVGSEARTADAHGRAKSQSAQRPASDGHAPRTHGPFERSNDSRIAIARHDRRPRLGSVGALGS